MRGIIVAKHRQRPDKRGGGGEARGETGASSKPNTSSGLGNRGGGGARGESGAPSKPNTGSGLAGSPLHLCSPTLSSPLLFPTTPPAVSPSPQPSKPHPPSYLMTRTPGASMGTSTIDCCRWVGAEGSVLPMKMAMLQRGSHAPEVHHLLRSGHSRHSAECMGVCVLEGGVGLAHGDGDLAPRVACAEGPPFAAQRGQQAQHRVSIVWRSQQLACLRLDTTEARRSLRQPRCSQANCPGNATLTSP